MLREQGRGERGVRFPALGRRGARATGSSVSTRAGSLQVTSRGPLEVEGPRAAPGPPPRSSRRHALRLETQCPRPAGRSQRGAGRRPSRAQWRRDGQHRHRHPAHNTMIRRARVKPATRRSLKRRPPIHEPCRVRLTPARHGAFPHGGVAPPGRERCAKRGLAHVCVRARVAGRATGAKSHSPRVHTFVPAADAPPCEPRKAPGRSRGPCGLDDRARPAERPRGGSAPWRSGLHVRTNA